MPVIIACAILNLLSKLHNNFLLKIAGWHGLMLTAWIGTPIHELSHFLAAVIANHKIRDIKLFQPNKRTGTVGYVIHSYNENSFYQSTIGNAIISIAPFFGGAAVIYILSSFLFSQFSLYGPDVPRLVFLTGESLNSAVFSAFLNSHLNFFKYLYTTFFSAPMLTNWKLYVFLFIMFGIANHLSPSAQDFQNFWTPLAIFLFGIFLLNLVISNLVKDTDQIIAIISGYTLKVMPLLYLAIFVSVIWLIIIFLIFVVLSIFKSR